MSAELSDITSDIDSDIGAAPNITEDKPPKADENNKKNTNRHENALNKEYIFNLKADRELRDRYGFKAYKVVKKSLWGWAILLAIYAACKFFYDKELFSENVLIAITSATTLNIFAAFLGVIRGLFPVNGSVVKESKEE